MLLLCIWEACFIPNFAGIQTLRSKFPVVLNKFIKLFVEMVLLTGHDLCAFLSFLHSLSVPTLHDIRVA